MTDQTTSPSRPILFEKPPVYATRTGVLFVKPEDIFASKTGQKVIRDASMAFRNAGPPERDHQK